MASQNGISTTHLPSARARFRALLAAALQQGHRASGAGLSSIALQTEQFLNVAGTDRLPWLAVGFAGGIGLWFALANSWLWCGVIVFGPGIAGVALTMMARQGRYGHLRVAVACMALAISAGCATVWAKSALIGTQPIAGTITATVTGRVLDRYGQPARHRVRLDLALREAGTNRPIRVHLSMPDHADRPDLVEGAIIRLRVRMMPPSSPSVPNGYDAARQAWFDGFAASGVVLGSVDIITPAPGDDWLARARHALSDHVRARVSGSAGGIAAAFASGDRGGISPADEQAMRDSGLTHLLSVSGLHVSALVAGAYLLASAVLGMVPWLALRVRLPLLASGFGALSGAGYTLLTGAQGPTVRSMLGALLALGALALGRQALSLRLLAVAGFCVMLLWPEQVVGPSFQMSFGSVLAIIVLHDSAPVRAFLAPREESGIRRMARHLGMTLLTGMVIDLALMPIALFHFNRAGIYGSLANLVAIPLTTFVSMPAIAAGLALDVVGLGGSAWWVCGLSLDLLLAIARWTAARPDAVTLMPAIGPLRFAMLVGGMLWLALWHGRIRVWGLLPATVAMVSLLWIRPPDVLMSSDGRSIGITGIPGHALLLLRSGQSTYVADTMLENAGMVGPVTALTQWPAMHCSATLCAMTLDRSGRLWRLLILRGTKEPPANELAQACRTADILISSMAVDASCHPALLKADGAMLAQTGGMALDLSSRSVTTVAQTQGDLPWWRGG